MNFENINTDSIKDLESAKKVISQLADSMFILKKDIQRQLDNLTSRNITSIDFNITKVQNIDTVLNNYATIKYVEENYQSL